MAPPQSKDLHDHGFHSIRVPSRVPEWGPGNNHDSSKWAGIWPRCVFRGHRAERDTSAIGVFKAECNVEGSRHVGMDVGTWREGPLGPMPVA